MSASDLVAAIKSATPDAPAIIRLEIWPEGVGNAPPPQEIIVKLFPADAPIVIPPTSPPPPPVPTTPDAVLWASGVTNVRKTPSATGALLGQLGRGQEITVTGDPVKTADNHIWRVIGKGPNVGGWVATDVLSATRPT